MPQHTPSDRWFTVEAIDADTYAISEYAHWEEPHCYLLNGDRASLLIDTGLGVGQIAAVAAGLAGRPVTAVLTHAHWDHMGGLRGFPSFAAHRAELDWLTGQFPLPPAAVRAQLRDPRLPAGFDLDGYRVFQGRPARLWRDGETIDLGDRQLRVLHTPGHSPGHVCYWEPAAGYLFTGDLVYLGELAADFPSTDPQAYLRSLRRAAALPVRRILPGHHSLDVPAGLAGEMAAAFARLNARGLLRHGAGRFAFDGWSVRL